jgi:hypothetical protein
MESVVLLPRSQESIIGPHPVGDEFSHALFLKLLFEHDLPYTDIFFNFSRHKKSVP